MRYPRWPPSSGKHGIERADALHAMRSPTVYLKSFDDSRSATRSRPDLFIGPNQDRTEILEVLAVTRGTATGAYVFHVMPLRPKTLERMRHPVAERKRNAPG